MSFADACLVRMSEIHSDCAIWTLDSDSAFIAAAAAKNLARGNPKR